LASIASWLTTKRKAMVEVATNSPLQDDLRDLQSFVIQLRELLQAVVDDGRYIPVHLDDVRAAWVHAKDDLNSLAEQLRAEVTQGDRTAKLRQHGLTGRPLQMKLRALRSRMFRFVRRTNRPWLRSLLRWSDTILGSLAGAMTLRAAGKEFKEAIESSWRMPGRKRHDMSMMRRKCMGFGAVPLLPESGAS
jgi:hypothetical protein